MKSTFGEITFKRGLSIFDYTVVCNGQVVGEVHRVNAKDGLWGADGVVKHFQTREQAAFEMVMKTFWKEA